MGLPTYLFANLMSLDRWFCLNTWNRKRPNFSFKFNFFLMDLNEGFGLDCMNLDSVYC